MCDPSVEQISIANDQEVKRDRLRPRIRVLRPYTTLTMTEALVHAAHLVFWADPDEALFPRVLARVKQAYEQEQGGQG